MIEAVCGFFFSEDKSRLALIRKLKPEWQKGHLNGVGGKIETGEGAEEAMVREFDEETGAKTAASNWNLYFILDDHDHDFRIHYFRACGNVDALRSMEAEQIEIIGTKTLPPDMVHNLRWLIPMALDGTFSNGYGEWKD